MQKPYKKEELNKQLREFVRKYKAEIEPKRSVSWKYCSADEKTLDLMHWLQIKSYAMANRVREIICADGYHDNIALKTYGFNQHSA